MELTVRLEGQSKAVAPRPLPLHVCLKVVQTGEVHGPFSFLPRVEQYLFFRRLS